MELVPNWFRMSIPGGVRNSEHFRLVRLGPSKKEIPYASGMLFRIRFPVERVARSAWNSIDFIDLDTFLVLKSVSFCDFRGFCRKSEGVLSTQNQLPPDLQFAREQTIGFLMEFIGFSSF